MTLESGSPPPASTPTSPPPGADLTPPQGAGASAAPSLIAGESSAPGDTPPATSAPGSSAEPGAPHVPLTAADFTLPEGFDPKDESFTAFVEAANSAKLSKDGAAKLFDLHSKAMNAASEGNSRLWAETQETWRKQVETDKEIGGDKLQPTLGRVRQLVKDFGTPELIGVFDLTGAGNHPEMIRFLGKIAEKMGEGKPVAGQTASGAGERSLEERLYPTS